MKVFSFILFLLLIILSGNNLSADVVNYELTIDYKDINITGKPVKSMVINDQLPGPTLEFTEGDFARIKVTNNMDVNTTIHWHGLLVPAEQDGVPYINTLPIKPDSTLLYEFPIKQSGTYWYHSHTDLQEQRGLRGAIVIHPKKETLQYDRELVLLLADWTDEDPKKILANLKKDGDYYALKKGSVQSLYGFISNNAVGKWFQGRWTRMGTMDLSDIGYDAFLANGRKEFQFRDVIPGERVRLRIINGSTSTYFYLEAAGMRLHVVSADGVNVEPFKVDELLIAVAETYDLIFTIPAEEAFELRATAQDGTGYSSTIFGSGKINRVKDRPRPNLYRMGHAGMEHGSMEMKMNSDSEHNQPKSMKHNNMEMMKMPVRHENAAAEKFYYKLLKATRDTTVFGTAVREIPLTLTGNMETYTWSFNNNTISQADKIMIKKGEVARFILENKTMMHHPLHLHGHFFRVLVGNGKYEPLKHTVDIKPMQTVIIEFYANEEKDWFFHCHNLYHARTGMARVVHYEGTSVDPKLAEAEKNKPDIKDTDYYYVGELGLLWDYFYLDARYSNISNAFEIESEWTEFDDFEGSAVYLRRINRWTEIFAGIEHEEDETLPVLGITYVLPLLIDADLQINSDGDVTLELSTEIQLTDRMQANLLWDTDDNYRLALEYRITKNFSLEYANVDEVHNTGGIKFRF
jgi:FtsP/CotA-like multicopper oxidase with cupredoxin domain